MTRGVRLLGLVLLVFAAACGGRTETEPTAEAGAAGRPAGDAGGGGGSNTFGNADDLPECVPGFAPGTPGRGTCDWLAGGLCYSSRTAACACVCPKTGRTLCTSGFPNGPDGRTRVTCTKAP